MIKNGGQTRNRICRHDHYGGHTAEPPDVESYVLHAEPFDVTGSGVLRPHIYSLYHRKLGFSVGFLLLRLYFDYADGLLARKYKMTSKFGDWYDHIVDVMFAVGLFSVVLLSKYPAKYKIGCVIALVVFFILFSVQMGCIEKEHIKEKKDKEETSVSRLRHLCPDGSECIIKAFDNGTLCTVLILVMVVICKHKKMSLS